MRLCGKAFGNVLACGLEFFSSYVSADVAILSEWGHLLFR